MTGASFSAALKAATASTAIDWSTDGKTILDGYVHFLGRAEDYHIYFAAGESSVTVRRRANAGFPGKENPQNSTPGSELFKVPLEQGLVFFGNVDGSSGGSFSIAPGALQTYMDSHVDGGEKHRVTFSSQTSSANMLYRVNDEQLDIVYGGRGNDQLRIGPGGINNYGREHDVFYGGDGVDTVYLPGPAERYRLGREESVNPDEPSLQFIYDTFTRGKLTIENVERVRLSGATTNNGYLPLAKLKPFDS